LKTAFAPLKTSKCFEVAHRQRDAVAQGVTVSMLKEAVQFFDADGHRVGVRSDEDRLIRIGRIPVPMQVWAH